MQVELHVQPGTVIDPAALLEFARRALVLEHPTLVKILDVCLDDAGCAVLVTRAAGGPLCELHRISSPVLDPATACSMGLSLAEALDHLHRVQFRGGMSLSWDESVRAVLSGDGRWHLAVMPPTPAQIAMSSTAGGFTGVDVRDQSGIGRFGGRIEQPGPVLGGDIACPAVDVVHQSGQLAAA